MAVHVEGYMGKETKLGAFCDSSAFFFFIYLFCLLELLPPVLWIRICSMLAVL